MNALLRYEKIALLAGFRAIAGIDEAGRGPLAGPVYAAACILCPGVKVPKVNDSKQLTPLQRERVFCELTRNSAIWYGVGVASAEEIDACNILQATFLAMQRAVANLPHKPDYLLIDGNRSPKWEIPYTTIVKGDCKSASIAAASIIAKVLRDREMDSHHERWPMYGFKDHKGYGTKQHLEALKEWGPCPLHRNTFAPVRSWVKKGYSQECSQQ